MAQGTVPLVSVVTPAYNAAEFVVAAIESVTAQTFDDWEMIIVDDCSNDRTLAIGEKFARADARICVTRSSSNQGPGPTRNQAVSMARGRYLAFLDADDLWHPRKLERQLAFMKEKRCAFSFTGYDIISSSNQRIGSLENVLPQVTYVDLLKNNPIGCLTVMLDREKTGGVRFPSFRTNQDFALWLQILKSGITAHGLDEILASYRIVANSNTRSKWKSARGVWRVYRSQQLPLLRTLWLYAHYAVRGTVKHFRTGAFAGDSAASHRSRRVRPPIGIR